MKVVHFLVMLFACWPAIVVGYVVGAIRSGWETGLFFQDKHEAEAVARINARKDPKA